MVFMPQTDAASTARGQQQAALAAVIHEQATSKDLGDLLTKARKELLELDGGLDVPRRVVELAEKAYNKTNKIPADLATQKAKLSTEAYNIWAKARAEDDFSAFQGIFSECIEVAREIATVQQTDQDRANGKPLYATMLDEYEVGMDPKRIVEIFETIQSALVPLIEKVLGPDATPPDTSALRGDFPIDQQEALNKELVRAIGFDDSQGRIDVSVHPFTSAVSGPADVRITSRFRTDEWYQGLAGSIHEGGHALYEQHLETSGLPVDSALSMGMHESQSLFWERHIGLSLPYWKFAGPKVNDHLNTSHTPEELYGAVNAAQRSLIRVEADELTYPLHVILRYGIERDFVEGRLDVKDLPQRWTEDMKKLLGVESVPSNAEGCLQDVHWSMMAYGYFPTYLIGAATAAQLAHYCAQQVPDFEGKVAKGEFTEIREWLTDKVHRHGSRYSSLDAHLEAQLGEPLNPKYFVDYLTDKYTSLYQC